MPTYPPLNLMGLTTDRVLLTTAEAAKALHVSRSTVYTLIGQGALRPVHIGRSCRFSLRELQRYVDRLDTSGGHPGTVPRQGGDAAAQKRPLDRDCARPMSAGSTGGWDGDSAA